MNNIFITGGTGFLGTHLTNNLKDEHNVTVLIRDHKPKSYFYSLGLDKEVNIVKGDFTNGQLIKRVLTEHEIDTVFHLGAQSIVNAGNTSPIGTFESNIKGSWEVLDACRIADVDRVVVASSDKAYGTHDELPYSEYMALKGEHPYDVSKSCMDLITQSYYKTYGLSTSITRCANLYGAGDYNFSRLIPRLVRSVFTNEEITLRGKGLMERDFLYVSDAVRAYKMLAQKNDIETRGQAFNFGNGEPIQIKTVVEELEKAINKKLNIKIVSQAQNEILSQYLDSQKAKEVLDWKPLVNLHHGLKHTFDEYSKYKNNFLRGHNE